MRKLDCLVRSSVSLAGLLGLPAECLGDCHRGPFLGSPWSLKTQGRALGLRLGQSPSHLRLPYENGRHCRVRVLWDGLWGAPCHTPCTFTASRRRAKDPAITWVSPLQHRAHPPDPWFLGGGNIDLAPCVSFLLIEDMLSQVKNSKTTS